MNKITSFYIEFTPIDPKDYAAFRMAVKKWIDEYGIEVVTLDTGFQHQRNLGS
jgi:predicted ATP-grasp superfamily ATP-dependent carboligase